MEGLRIFDTYLYEISKGTKPVALVTFEGLQILKIKKKELEEFFKCMQITEKI